MTISRDIVIVGGGPVGATLALALHENGIASTLLEARQRGTSHQDQRALALSFGTRLILERLGIWPQLSSKATAINTIHISQRGSFGRTLLKAEDHGQEALGYVLSYGALSQALDDALSGCHSVEVLHGAEATEILPDDDAATVTFNHEGIITTYRAPLLVLADGGRSLGDIPGLNRETREYGHDALVAKVQAELPHNHIAYERFTPSGPAALLPNGAHDFSLVWTGRREEVAAVMQLDDAAFLLALHQHFGDRVGRFLKVGKRLAFPLRLSRLNPVAARHLVVIGNAAQTMHPVAGQGFNVGLRDAWELADLIAESPVGQLGTETMLKTYADNRRTDTKNGLLFTDFLVNLFSNDVLGVSPLRALGLGALDLIKPAKHHLVRKMSFGPRG
ncbi:2-octaprenyl-6-methoxyphenol hydroxylase [Methylophilaceae bacterium]|nr:2-octaprenyl-6-methoxyphenol hydroxylase [Methylophilaceae bacterium]